MADKYTILAATDYNVRAQIAAALNELDTRVDIIIAFLQLEPNVLTFGVGADPDWTIVNGDIPIVALGSSGGSPPTVVGDAIVINSPGFYDITCQFGIDIVAGNNTVTVQPQVNAVDAGLIAGVEFSGGQAAPINQPQARIAAKLAAGDLVTFVATELGTADKLILWNISGGTAVQSDFDFDALNPPAETGVFLHTRFLAVEWAKIGDAINQTKLLPGPPPPDLDEYAAEMTMFIGHIGRFPVKVTNPYIVAFVNEMELRGVIAAGRAAVILAP